MNCYGKAFSPQEQVLNNAGGSVYKADIWARLRRWLILGSDSNTYYTSACKLTRENAPGVIAAWATDPVRTADLIVDVSTHALAPKNDAAIFALALGAASPVPAARSSALEALPLVCRTSTHLFQFVEEIKGTRGWGRGLRSAVRRWYERLSDADLAYQAVKYRQRGRWTHRDLLRLCHPKGVGTRNALYRWMTHGEPVPDLPLIAAFEGAQHATTPAEAAEWVAAQRLPWEAVPTQFLGSPEVWEALLPHMPLTATIRNLAKMTTVGLLAPFSPAVEVVTSRLGDAEYIHRSRVHPFALLLALKTYATGHGFRGSLTWEPVSSVVDALNEAFYAAFANVTPTGKRVVLALDVSGSMSWPTINNTNLTPREAAAAFALVTARTEPEHVITAFSHDIVPVEISPRERLDDVCAKLERIPMGGTDCALPMLWALGKTKNRRVVPGVDAFCTYTDNETWYGNVSPMEALRAYRREVHPDAKLVVSAFTSTGFTIADPNDLGCMDCVGLDASLPQVIADFIRGQV